MTRILRNTFGASLLVVAAMSMAGCPAALIPGAPTMGSSAVPSMAPGATPPAGGGSTATPAPAATSPAACSRTEPSMPKITGNASMGEYNGQGLPNGWDTYDSESEVTEAIRKMEATPDWACFQKFYPGATTVYKKHK